MSEWIGQILTGAFIALIAGICVYVGARLAMKQSIDEIERKKKQNRNGE